MSCRRLFRKGSARRALLTGFRITGGRPRRRGAKPYLLIEARGWLIGKRNGAQPSGRTDLRAGTSAPGDRCHQAVKDPLRIRSPFPALCNLVSKARRASYSHMLGGRGNPVDERTMAVAPGVWIFEPPSEAPVRVICPACGPSAILARPRVVELTSDTLVMRGQCRRCEENILVML